MKNKIIRTIATAVIFASVLLCQTRMDVSTWNYWAFFVALIVFGIACFNDGYDTASKEKDSDGILE